MFTPAVKLLKEGLGTVKPVTENLLASHAELSRTRLKPPVYSERPLRLLPNACDSAYCEVAALFTLPLISSPSLACCDTASGTARGASGTAALACCGAAPAASPVAAPLPLV